MKPESQYASKDKENDQERQDSLHKTTERSTSKGNPTKHKNTKTSTDKETDPSSTTVKTTIMFSIYKSNSTSSTTSSTSSATSVSNNSYNTTTTTDAVTKNDVVANVAQSTNEPVGNDKDTLVKFSRKELVLGELLDYSTASCRYYAIDEVVLQKRNKHTVRSEVALSPHKYAALLIHSGNADSAELLAELPTHEHLLSVHGVYTTKHSMYLVVDRMWCTLSDCLDQWASRVKMASSSSAPPPLLERLFVLQQTAKALRHLHRNNVVLGEVSPEAIAFDMDGTLRLMDLSGASWVYSNNNSTDNDGTFQRKTHATEYSIERALSTVYTAPEVSKGDEPERASDVFGFTLLLWHVLMLRPVVANKAQEYRRLMRKSNWPLWAKDIVQHGLEADPVRRTNMRDVERCLFKVIQHEQAKDAMRGKRSLATGVTTSSSSTTTRSVSLEAAL